jgi:hypothetical protein
MIDTDARKRIEKLESRVNVLSNECTILHIRLALVLKYFRVKIEPRYSDSISCESVIVPLCKECGK